MPNSSHLVVLLAVSAVACGSTSDAIDSEPVPTDCSRWALIGAPTAPNDDAVVSIVRPSSGSLCSATVVGPTTLATAAHCVEEGDIDGMEVRFGAEAWAGQPQNIAAFVRAPGYQSDTNANDLALVSLLWPVPPTVGPMAWLPSSVPLPAEFSVRVIAFGIDDDGQGGTRREATGTVILVCDAPSGCSNTEIPEGIVPWIPGGTLLVHLDNGVRPCAGDSGGAVLFAADGQEYLAGVVSTASSSCDGSYLVATQTASSPGFLSEFLSAYPAPPDVCLPAFAEVGTPCARHDQCGPDGYCVTEASDRRFTAGYCTSVCETNAECAEGAVCVAGSQRSFCWLACATSSECRTGYACVTLGEQSFCYPG